MIYDIQILVIILIGFEYFEFFWQKGDTFKAYFQTLSMQYDRGVVYFISLHPSFFFILFCIFALNLESFFLFTIALVKATDIFLKLSLLHKLEQRLPLGNFSPLFQNDFPLSTFTRLMPLILYSFSFYLCLLGTMT